MLPLPAVGAVAALAAGCALPDYRVAELQVDVDTPLPAEAATLHLCVSGFGSYDAGAGNGRAAFAGLPVGQVYEVEIDVLDEAEVLLGRARATVDEATPWALAPWEAAPADPPCEDRGHGATAGEPDLLLVTRFDESETPWDAP